MHIHMPISKHNQQQVREMMSITTAIRATLSANLPIELGVTTKQIRSKRLQHLSHNVGSRLRQGQCFIEQVIITALLLQYYPLCRLTIDRSLSFLLITCSKRLPKISNTSPDLRMIIARNDVTSLPISDNYWTIQWPSSPSFARKSIKSQHL